VHLIVDHFGFLMQGVLYTLGLTVFGFVGALVLGTLLAVCRVGPITPLRVLGSAYVEFFRNIPLLSLLVLVIFGLPDAGVTIPLFASAALCLALSASAFACEAMRGGINSVAVGQAEAARAIGFSFAEVLRFVVLPQAFRAMVQPLVNVFIGVLLSSALAAAVGVAELTNRTQQLNLKYAEAVVCFLFAGAVYLVIALAGGAVGGRLERRVAIKR
jgi:glutamate transport system permease protein